MLSLHYDEVHSKAAGKSFIAYQYTLTTYNSHSD